MVVGARSIALGLLMLLAACAGERPPPVRAVPGTPETADAKVAGALSRLQLVPRPAEAGSGVAASIHSVPASWSICRPMLLADGDDRFRMVNPTSRQGSVTVITSPAATGTEVQVTPMFEATYRNAITGTSFQSACESTGVLEQKLLDAAG